VGRPGPEELGCVMDCDAAVPVEVDAVLVGMVEAENSPSISEDYQHNAERRQELTSLPSRSSRSSSSGSGAVEGVSTWCSECSIGIAVAGVVDASCDMVNSSSLK